MSRQTRKAPAAAPVSGSIPMSRGAEAILRRRVRNLFLRLCQGNRTAPRSSGSGTVESASSHAHSLSKLASLPKESEEGIYRISSEFSKIHPCTALELMKVPHPTPEKRRRPLPSEGEAHNLSAC